MISYTEPYSSLAMAYDRIVEHVDYQQWYQHIRSIMTRYVENPELVLELGCGTGRFGAKFSADGYRIFGLDRSVDMLRVARARTFKNFRVFCGDMTAFAVSGKFDFIFSVHDTMNYLLHKNDVRKAFRCARGAMHEGSIFMFDITTEYNIANNFENVTNTYDISGCTVEWGNSFDRRRRLVRSTLRFHGADGSVEEENHYQRIYSVEEISALLEKEKFELLGVFSDYSFRKPGPKTVMINFVARMRI
jgi:SAM-dependent methyltransferase